MRKNYFMYILLCALLINPLVHAFSKREVLPLKKNLTGSYYINSTTDPDWYYTCKDGIEVELLSQGLKDNVPSTLAIPDIETIDRIVVEIVYKTQNPGTSIQIEDDLGNIYTAERKVPGDRNDVWYYRFELPPTTSVTYNNTFKASYAQSILAYVFRRGNTGSGSVGYFTSLSGYNDIKTITVPINTDTGPRSVKVELPISELTDDGRYIHLEASAADGSFAELTDAISSFPDGKCCIKIYELTLNNVAGNINEIKIQIDTRHNKNGMTVNGQSWVMASSIKTDVKCSCVDFDTDPPYTEGLADRRILEDILQMPNVMFWDDCSAVTIEYKEYEDAKESCWLDFGPQDQTTNVQFFSFPFDEDHHWENGYFVRYNDGTAKVFGRIVNNSEPTSGWIVEIYFEDLMSYSTWVASGGTTENDAQQQYREYANVDFSKPYTFRGFGSYKDSDITLLSDGGYHHMDIGPKDAYGDYGLGFWISYEGTVNGETIGGQSLQHVEGASSLTKCVKKRARYIIREWVVTDAAGNSNVYIQRVELEQ